MNDIVIIPNRYLFNFGSCHGQISSFFLPEDCDVNCAAASKERSKQEIKQLTNESALMQTKTVIPEFGSFQSVSFIQFTV